MLFFAIAIVVALALGVGILVAFGAIRAAEWLYSKWEV